jgi:hypothetical protein
LAVSVPDAMLLAQPDGRTVSMSFPPTARRPAAGARLHKPQMTAAEFNTGLREAGFAVDHGRIVDVSGRCPGFATYPAFHGRGVVNRNTTLTKAIRERDAEIAQRAAAEPAD